MFFGLTAAYSLWLTIPCIILGIAYAMLLYYREKRYEFRKITVRLLFALRTLSIFLIAFLLLSPIVKAVKKHLEKPLIIIAQDNSASLVYSSDSAFIRKEYSVRMKELIETLGNDYDVKCYTFGEKATAQQNFLYNEKQTDFTPLFSEIEARFSGRNIGAMIIASDGIYNMGYNPQYLADKLSFPVFTIALGDTMQQKDVLIAKTNHNKISYLGNSFPVEILVKASKCKGQKTNITLSRGGQQLFSKTIDITSDDFLEDINIELESDRAGVQHYTLILSRIDGEINEINNRSDFFVEVIDGREKILIIASSPHPDVAALKQSITASKIYEVQDTLADNIPYLPDGYNLVIFHQIPVKGKNHLPLIRRAEQLKLPVLYILGTSSDLNIFNTLKTGLSITQSQGRYNEAIPMFAPEFALFTLSDGLKKTSAQYPALLSPFGNYSAGNSVHALFYQKIGSVSTQNPLIMFNTAMEPKTGIIAGEGLWKWKLNNYLHYSNHDLFNELTNKIIQYLSVKEDKGKFRMNTKTDFKENEEVVFDAEVYNDSYELINIPEVKLTITNSAKKSFPFTFSKTDHAYFLNAGYFPVGEYNYRAEVSLAGKIFTKTGLFTVSQLNTEALNLVADHNLLYALASKHNGRMLYPGEMNRIADLLKEREEITTVSWSSKTYTDLVSILPVLLVIILLLATEWFIRKYNGTY